jgi:uncharacterized repeat protein (TIGR03833 family)
MGSQKSGEYRDAIRIGLYVDIIQKADQHSGKLTRGRIKEILTNSLMHPHGIKVRLEDGCVGRVIAIIDTETDGTKNGTSDKEKFRRLREPEHPKNLPHNPGSIPIITDGKNVEER